MTQESLKRAVGGKVNSPKKNEAAMMHHERRERLRGKKQVSKNFLEHLSDLERNGFAKGTRRCEERYLSTEGKK